VEVNSSEVNSMRDSDVQTLSGDDGGNADRELDESYEVEAVQVIRRDPGPVGVRFGSSYALDSLGGGDQSFTLGWFKGFGSCF